MKKVTPIVNQHQKVIVLTSLGVGIIVFLMACIFFIKSNSNKDIWREKNVLKQSIEIGMPFEEKVEILNSSIKREANDSTCMILEAQNDIIIQYFKDNLNIDLSDNFKKLKGVFIFGEDETYEKVIIDKTTNNILINESVINDSNLLKSCYTRQIIYYLGADKESKWNYFKEGIVDAVAEDIMGEEYQCDMDCIVQRKLAKQLMIANKKEFLISIIGDNHSIYDLLNSKLKGVKRDKDCNIDNPALFIETATQIMTSVPEGEVYVNAALQAEFIVVAYAKTYDLTKEQIEGIRSNYIILDFEDQYYLY